MRLELLSRIRDAFIEQLRDGETVDVEEFLEPSLTHEERVELREQLEECVAIHARLEADASGRPSAERIAARVIAAIAEQPSRRSRRETSAPRPAVGERAAKTPRSTPRRLIVPLTGVAAAIVAALLWWTGAFTQAAWSVSIAGGQPGGFHYQFAQVMSAGAHSSFDGRLSVVHPIATTGSVANLARLTVDEGRADMAVVLGADISDEQPGLEDIAVISRLHREYLHILVRDRQRATTPRDMDGAQVYLGRVGSTSRRMAEEAMATWQVTAGSTSKVASPAAAVHMLIAGELDAVFILDRIPSPHVAKALASGSCSLLAGPPVAGALTRRALVLRAPPARRPENAIPASDVPTVSTDVYLMGRADLPRDLVVGVLDALFDSIHELAASTGDARGISLADAFDFTSLPAAVATHGGVAEFREQEVKRLYIASGSVHGKYAQIARVLQASLREWGIPARVVHTDGSVANMASLAARPTLAIAQYDVAVAAITPALNPHYGASLRAAEVAGMYDLRSIAALHEERVHVFARRDRVSDRGSVLDLEGRDVAVGPPESGTHVLAKAVLDQHGVSVRAHAVGIDETIRRLLAGDIDAGFFVGAAPSPAVQALLDYEGIRLLSMEPAGRISLLDDFGLGLLPARIEPGTYPCQLAGERGVATVATRAVLVTTADLPFDVAKITEAVFAAAAHLDVAGGADAMARPLPSIELHADARDYYRAAGLLPQAPRVARLRVWVVVSIASLGFAVAVAWRWRRMAARIECASIAVDAAGLTFNGSREAALQAIKTLERLSEDAALLGRGPGRGEAARLDARIDRRLSAAEQVLARLQMEDLASALRDRLPTEHASPDTRRPDADRGADAEARRTDGADGHQ